MPPTRRKSATPTPPAPVEEELPELEQIRIGLDKLLEEVKALKDEIG